MERIGRETLGEKEREGYREKERESPETRRRATEEAIPIWYRINVIAVDRRVTIATARPLPPPGANQSGMLPAVLYLVCRLLSTPHLTPPAPKSLAGVTGTTSQVRSTVLYTKTLRVGAPYIYACTLAHTLTRRRVPARRPGLTFRATKLGITISRERPQSLADCYSSRTTR